MDIKEFLNQKGFSLLTKIGWYWVSKPDGASSGCYVNFTNDTHYRDCMFGENWSSLPTLPVRSGK